MTVTQAIEMRKSVRNYSGVALTPEQIKYLSDAIEGARSPFGGEVAVKLAAVGNGGEFKPSTYGVIRGAMDYILVGIADNRQSYLSAGFIVEQVVVEATSLGLGTCWMTGTFKGSTFASAAGFPEATPLKAVIPVGRGSSKKGILDTISRALAHSDSRKPFDKLFYAGAGLPLGTDNPFRRPLELMRLAPSSVNSQPWRAFVHPGRVEFYTAAVSNNAYIDMGIALSHFMIGCDEEDIQGHLLPLSEHDPAVDAALTPVAVFSVS